MEPHLLLSFMSDHPSTRRRWSPVANSVLCSPSLNTAACPHPSPLTWASGRMYGWISSSCTDGRSFGAIVKARQHVLPFRWHVRLKQAVFDVAIWYIAAVGLEK